MSSRAVAITRDQDIHVYPSGHTLPASKFWLKMKIAPIRENGRPINGQFAIDVGHQSW
jgi:hypothetical protein